MKNVLVLLLTLVYFTSCSPEVDFVEPFTSDEVIDNENGPEEEIVVSKDPCDFTLENAEAGETIIIDCVMDLGGKTINLPSDVTLEYEGGTITNGTLNFNNGIIDGRFLNSKLEIEGTANLLDVTFEFNPKKWDIEQGEIAKNVAQENKEKMQNLIDLISSMGGKVFQINTFDAYFNISGVNQINEASYEHGIHIPSNFKLSMSDDTYLRVYPNEYKKYCLLNFTNGISNSGLEGGNLIGDRDEHDYSKDEGTQEWGHVVMIAGATNITIRGAKMAYGSGDGLDIRANVIRTLPNHITSTNILITDCVFDSNRRNNLSITDGRDIIIENCSFLNAGVHTNYSQGIAPSFAIDVEAYKTMDANGVITHYEIAEDIIIRNNKESGSRKGGFLVHTGDRVTFESNEMQNGISISNSTETIIKNNVFQAVTDLQKNNGTAIGGGRDDRYERNFGNRIYGNTIKDYANGISMSNLDLEVYDNNIINCKTGLTINTLKDSKIYNNTIKSNNPNSDGIVNGPASQYIDNVTVSGNNVEVLRTPLKFFGVNEKVDQNDFVFIIDNNIFKSSNTSTISNCRNITFTNNTITEGGLRLEKAQNTLVSKNKNKTTTSHGIRIDGGCVNININNNDISVAETYKCIEQTTNDGINISITNNICN